MASWAELRERQRVKVALYKGEPVLPEDHAMVCEVLERLRWNRPLALVWAVLSCAWIYLLLFAHGTLRWTAILFVFVAGLHTWTLLRQYKRITIRADTLGFRRGRY